MLNGNKYYDHPDIATSSIRLAEMSIDKLMNRAPSGMIDLFRKTASKHNVNIKSARTRRNRVKISSDAIIDPSGRVS